MGKDSDQFDFLVILHIPLVESLQSSCDVMGVGDIPCLIILATVTKTQNKT